MTLQQFFSVLKRRQLIVWCVVAVGLALMYSLRGAVPSSFSGVSHVVLVAENGSRDPSVGIVDLPSIATSTVVLERVRNSLKLPMSLIALKANVSASVLGRSSIMAIGFRDASAERAINVSNSVADQLSRYYDEISTARYDVNVNRLSAELTNEDHKLRAMNAQMSKVVAVNPYVVSERSNDDITGDLATLEQQRATAQSQLEADQALAQTMVPSVALSKTARHEILADDPTYLAATKVAATDRTQLAVDEATYTKSFPGLPGEIAKVQGESAAIHAEATRALRDPNAFSPAAAATALQHAHQMAIVTGDVAHVAQVNALIATDQQRLGQLPTVGSQYAQLVAQRTEIQTEYDALATRRANALANRAEASSLGSVVVLDRAIKADTQLAGGRSRAAVVAFLLVVAVAFGLAFLVDSLDPRIRRREDIEELYGIPVVASFGAKS